MKVYSSRHFLDTSSHVHYGHQFLLNDDEGFHGDRLVHLRNEWDAPHDAGQYGEAAHRNNQCSGSQGDISCGDLQSDAMDISQYDDRNVPSDRLLHGDQNEDHSEDHCEDHCEDHSVVHSVVYDED